MGTTDETKAEHIWLQLATKLDQVERLQQELLETTKSFRSQASLTESSQKQLTQQLARLVSLSAELILVLKRADHQRANDRLQDHAALNRILEGQDRLLHILTDPEALAGAVERPVLDAARRIKRTIAIAVSGKDPAKERRREDEITLVSIPLGHGKRKAFKMNKHLAKLLITLAGFGLAVLAHKLGMPLP